jgi:hypothetical protein
MDGSSGLVAAPSPPGPTVHTVDVTDGGEQRLTITLTPHTQPVERTAATVTYPLVTVSGADTALARRVADTLNSRISVLRGGYRARLISLHRTDVPLTQTIRVHADARWGRTLSIVLDDIEDYGEVLADSTSTAVVIDTLTGQPLAAGDLFTDVDAADALMRKAILASVGPGQVTPQALGRLSMRPGRHASTRPLTWYPTAEGLHWTVDPGAIISEAEGEPEATVGWSSFTGLLTPRARP